MDCCFETSKGPVTWWDEKLEEKRNKEKLRKEKIAKLYPKKK